MANKFSQGTVVSAGMVIAGVDADNPPVTDSGSSSGSESGLQYPLVGSDGPVHIEGDFSIIQDGFTSWTFEVEFTAPNDNQYRNIFTLGGTSDKKHGALTAYTTNAGDILSMTSSSSGTTTDGYNYWLSGAAGEGWTGAPIRLTIIRDGNIGRTAIYKDGVFVNTHQTKAHPTWSSSVKWPTTHFEGADLTFFAYADDSVLMGDGTGVEIHGWNFSKTNAYADQGVTGSGGTITNLLPLTQTAPETPNPYVDPYAGDFIMASPSGRAISWNGGWDAIDMLHWISYGTYGENGTRSINTPGGASAIHHMRYDPVSKRVFALFTGGEAALENNGFGGYSTDNSSGDFFTGYYYNNVTWASPTMGVVASRNQYEPEDIPGLNITWNGTSWTKAAASPTNVIVGSMWSEGTGRGSAAIYDITTGSQTLKVTQPGEIQSQYANFGRIVAANSTKFAVGAPAEVINGNVQNGGEVIVYDIDGSNPVSISYADNVDTTSGDEFGDALAISDNYVWTGIWKGESSGRSGRGQLVRHNFDGSLASVIDGPVNVDNAFFGKQVAWTGSHIVCTAPGPNGFSGNYSDGYFAVYTEDGTHVETVTLTGSKGKLFGDMMNVTDASCTSNKVVLREKGTSKVYLYDLDAADIAGSMVMVASNPNATTVGIAVNDDYVYVGLNESGQTDTIKVYSHDGTHQFDITPSTEVLSGAGNPAGHLHHFGVNIEATNNHIFTAVTSSGALVVLDASGNHVTSINTNGGSYSGYWTGGAQFFA